MNVIASLIPVNPDKAEQVVEDLSELFRASLQRAGTFVRISEELDLCQRYLHIESLRLGERLRVQWQVETAPAAAEMPLLILQPLLENAIYHGIQPLPEGAPFG
jgi:two-component system sensor histidine kinase AlgZ